MPASMIYVIRKNDKNMASDIKSGIAHKALGTIKRRTGRSEGYLKIAGIELILYEVEDGGLKRYLKKVPKETQFQVYYIPLSKRILSIEVMDE